MANASISFTFGSLSFSGEGEEGWLAKQLDKILTAAPNLSELHAPSETTDSPEETKREKFDQPLAAYIRAKGGESNQVQRFLATADWLRLRGKSPLTAGGGRESDYRESAKAALKSGRCIEQKCCKGLL